MRDQLQADGAVYQCSTNFIETSNSLFPQKVSADTQM